MKLILLYPSFGRFIYLNLFLSTMKKYVLIFLVVFFIFVACTNQVAIQNPESPPANPGQVNSPSQTPAPEVTTTDTAQRNEIASEVKSCTFTSDCPSGKECINQQCGQLFEGICPQKCQFTKIDASTSDREKYTLTPGQGSYTAAGALEWKILRHSHCRGEKIVLFQFTERNTGTILGNFIYTVAEGEHTPVITHPQIKRVAFTITVDKVEEQC